MRIVLHNEIPEDDNLRRQWNCLAEKMEPAEVFYTYEWALAVWRAYSATVEPLLLLAYDGDLLAGVAALATGNNEKGTFFLAGFTADYCDFISLPERRTEVVACFLQKLLSLGAPMLTLANLPADSLTRQNLGTLARPHEYKIFSRPAYECAQVLIGSPEQRASVEKMAGGKEQLRYLKKNKIEIHHFKGSDEIARVLPNFFQWHAVRFGERSNVRSPERMNFLFGLAGLLSASGWMTASEMRIDGEPAGLWLGFTYGRHWFYYQTAFNKNFQRYSPGFCLALKIIEKACQSADFDYLDFGLGSEAYKQRVANSSRQTLHVTLVPSMVAYFRVAARYRAAATVKRSPRVEHALRRVLGQPAATGMKP